MATVYKNKGSGWILLFIIIWKNSAYDYEQIINKKKEEKGKKTHQTIRRSTNDRFVLNRFEFLKLALKNK